MKTIIVLLLAAVISGAHTSSEHQCLQQESRMREYWVDPSTRLMWAAKDNGKDVNWRQAMKYCQKLQLGGFSDWRLATINELRGIYDKNAESPGRDGQGISTWPVKANLFLTGLQWSSTLRTNDGGNLTGLPGILISPTDIGNDEDSSHFSGRFANYGRRALCVRSSGKWCPQSTLLASDRQP